MPKFLVVEDDFGSRRMMQKLLKDYGDVDVVVDGEEAVQAFSMTRDDDIKYAAIFLDIMMPRMDGHEALKRIRAMEKELGVNPASEVKIIMTTVLEDPRNVVDAYFSGGATSYLVKPVDRLKVRSEMQKLGFLPVIG